MFLSFFFKHQWAKWKYYTVAEEVVQSNILFYFTEAKDVKKIQLTLIWELCPKKLFPTLQNGKTKRSNNSEIPVCKRDFSTSGAMATDQFIMPATPTNKKKTMLSCYKIIFSALWYKEREQLRKKASKIRHQNYLLQHKEYLRAPHLFACRQDQTKTNLLRTQLVGRGMEKCKIRDL